MKKQEIYIEIGSEEKLSIALNALKEAGEKIWDHPTALVWGHRKYLVCHEKDNDWYITSNLKGRTNCLELTDLGKVLEPYPIDQDTYETNLMVQTSENIQYRIKTKEEFEATCLKNEAGEYICGEDFFVPDMEYLCGRVLEKEELEKIKSDILIVDDIWSINKEMITPTLNVDIVDSEKLQNIQPSTILKVSLYDEKLGKKETENKLDYSELNLDILDLMAQRMMANKHKYPEGNSKRYLNIKDLEWALFRHLKKMIKPIEGDEESYKDHLSAILCNASMILDQLELRGE